MDLVLLFNALKKRLWLILTVSVISVGLALYLTKGQPKLYRSYAQLSTGFTIEKQVSLTNDKLNLYEADVKFNNLIETFQSSTVVGLLSYQLLLHDLKSEKPFRKLMPQDQPVMNGVDKAELLTTLSNKYDSVQALNLYRPNERKIHDILLAYEYDHKSLNPGLNVSRVKRTDYVSLQAVSENPELSAFIVNTLCEAYSKYNSSIQSSLTVESVELFENLVAQKKRELDQKANALREFKLANTLHDLGAETSSRIEQLTNYEHQEEDENKKIRRLTLELENINRRIGRLDQGNDEALSGATVEVLVIRKHINELNTEYSRTGNRSLVDSIRVLRSKLIGLTAGQDNTGDEVSLDDLVRQRSQLETDMEIAEQNLASVRSIINKLKNNISGFASKEATINSLQRDIDLASKEYQSALEKYNKALDIAFNVGDNTIRQVIFGQPAINPEASKRLQVAAISGISSFLLCVIVIVILEYLDFSIKSPSNFKESVNLPLIGTLPRFKKVDFRKEKLKGASFMGLSSNGTDGDSKKFKGSKAEMYKNLIRKLRYELENEGKKVILFTSTEDHVGKTSVIISLALSLSLVRQRVLVVDANFSNNSLTRFFGAKETLGPGIDFNDLPSHFVQTEIPGVVVLGCQQGTFSPFEVFPAHKDSPRLFHFEGFDHVLIEAASLNNYPDTKELSLYADTMIAVFSAKTEVKQRDQDSIDFLKRTDKKFSGAVLNLVESENMDQ